MITAEKLREAVEKEMDCLPAPIGDKSMVYWFRVAAALEKLIADEPQPRELTDEAIENYYRSLQGKCAGLNRAAALVRWAIEQSCPCGPTAVEVHDAFYRLGRIGFCNWWKCQNIKPTAEVTAPLEERIAERESVIRACREDTERYKHALAKADDRIVELGEDCKAHLETLWAWAEKYKDLESQLVAAKADKSLDWKNMAINERLEAVGCRSVSDLMLTLHDDGMFSIEPRTDWPPCMTEEEMQGIVAGWYAARCYSQLATEVLSGISIPSSSRACGAVDAIRALAGRVPEKKSEPKPEWPKWYWILGNILWRWSAMEMKMNVGGGGWRNSDCLPNTMVNAHKITPAAAKAKLVEWDKKKQKPAERWYKDKDRNCVWVYRDDLASEFWGRSGLYHSPSKDLEDGLRHISTTAAEAEAIRAGWKQEQGK